MLNHSTKHVHAPVDQPVTGLRINIPRQTLELTLQGGVQKSYPVSTSQFGLGTEPGSYKTPLGRFAVSEKVGHDAPLGSIFKSRQSIGEIAAAGGDEDLILTRIFWLEGLEEQNANTKDRYIYIHGTNQENLIGTPASHGCVRMRNADIVELFDLIPEGTVVEILA